ncbi:MAG TPA: hypothetical protein VK034_01955 [Enhygromyxa sp.]|nr:hypothetical protein [Enhygromyxa sp.]
MRRLHSPVLAVLFTLGLICSCRQETGSPKADAPASAEPSSKPSAEPAEPPTEPLPDGAELLAAHVEASGGASQIGKFETVHMRGTVAVESHNLKGSMELWWQKDGKVYLEQDIEGIGKSRVGYDGETIWLDDPITGLRKLDGKEAASYLQSSLMFLGHDWPKHFSAANTIGKHKLGEGEVWEVELVSKAGPNLTVGIDADSKLIRYVKSVQPSMLGDMPIEVRSDRYESIEGYKFSMHKINAVSSLLELDETITEFEVNVPVDEALFGFPSKREVVPVDPAEQAKIEAPTDPSAKP